MPTPIRLKMKYESSSVPANVSESNIKKTTSVGKK